ncbi:hypothetical protein [Amaricoccus sp.]|uniref:hypothetical protein n=1 Tax=Amaricoccus sp. TaxID=1872485 RepID=UPI001B6CDFA9|nr:hypothetical protein [Amaricoccus sp.]MBP7002771.1 hypothetical protein [Amaricoccus sp.]
MDTITQPVTLTKRCKIHGIDLPREGARTARFLEAFPEAFYDEEAGEWRIVWEKGHFAESNARIEAFFADNGVSTVQVDRC